MFDMISNIFNREVSPLNQSVTAFFEEISGKRIAVMGIGVSHIDVIRMLAGKARAVIACDKREASAFESALLDEFGALGVELRLGEGYFDRLDFDILLRTPGMYFNLPRLSEFRDMGGIVTSEMELFFDLCPCKTIAVTGSDGKTTTTTLIAEMLKASGKTVHLGGNIGKALFPEIMKVQPGDFAVVELSSFQLISMRQSPDIAVITNVEPNHLDVHGDMQEYTDAKRNLYSHQNAFGIAVLNSDNEVTRSFVPLLRGQCRMFSLKDKVAGSWLRADGMLCYTDYSGETTELFNKKDIRLPGEHNIANYLTAIAAVWGIVPTLYMNEVARVFGGVEHRIEFVRELDSVKWYNDSIASSPTRSIAGLKAFGKRIVMLAGGYDKKIPYEPLAPYLVKYVRLLILMGDTAAKLEAACRADVGYNGDNPVIIHAKDMEEAVQIARRETSPGDIVTLSPASASFDHYPNFEVRGRHFKQLVNEL